MGTHRYTALYMLPTNLESCVKNYPCASAAVQAVKDKKHWGGMIHMTLCSFEDTYHMEDMKQAAEEAANAVPEEYKDNPFKITEKKWGECRVKDSLGIFDVVGQSRSLSA